VGADGDYVDLQTVFAGNENYLNADPDTQLFALPGVPEPTTMTLLGDVDINGEVDFLDIDPFIDLLSTGGFVPEADVNQDGAVNFEDIGPFIAILSGN